MDWLLNLGYVGLFVGTFLAGTIFPLSSDVLIIGMLAAGASHATSLILATLGNGLGAISSYALGWFGKWEWLGKWFKASQEKLDALKLFVHKYGVWGALFSWIPGVGNLLVIALGFYRVKPRLCMLLLFMGCFIRFSFWTFLHYYF